MSFNMKWRSDTKEKFVRCQGRLVRSISFLWSIKSVRRKIVAFPVCVTLLTIVASWSFQSNSCALNAFLCLIAFDVLTLVGDIFSHLYTHRKPSTNFSFGYVRVEVLTHFGILCLGLLFNLWTVKKSLELMLWGENLEIHTGRFLPSVLLGGLVHFFLSFNNSPILKIYKISASATTLQKYFQGICASFGLSLSSSSIFSLSPLAVLGLFCCNTVIILALALQSGPRWFDFVGGIFMILIIFDALWPLCIYTGQVLLQTVPAHTASQLEQAVREAMTIDGVLEFRNELFWTLSYGQIAGTVHVRIRRDASEQLVLSKVYEKLQALVPHLTVQVMKDDFGRQFPLHMVHDVSPLSKVAVVSNDLTPITKIPGALSNAMFTGSSVASSHLLYNASQISGVGINDTVSSTPPRSTESSVLQVHVDPKINPFNHHHHHNPTNMNVTSIHSTRTEAPVQNLQLPYHAVHSPIYSQANGRHNPFAPNTNKSSNMQNILMSSANFFPE